MGFHNKWDCQQNTWRTIWFGGPRIWRSNQDLLFDVVCLKIVYPIPSYAISCLITIFQTRVPFVGGKAEITVLVVYTIIPINWLTLECCLYKMQPHKSAILLYCISLVSPQNGCSHISHETGFKKIIHQKVSTFTGSPRSLCKNVANPPLSIDEARMSVFVFKASPSTAFTQRFNWGTRGVQLFSLEFKLFGCCVFLKNPVFPYFPSYPRCLDFCHLNPQEDQ